MFISPQVAIAQNWIRCSGCHTEDDWDRHNFISPNAIDFTLDVLKTVDSSRPAHLCNDKKRCVMRPNVDVPIIDGVWTLDRGEVYDGMSNMYVVVPEGVACVLYSRSSFTRNGVFIMSGLYDSGYEGHVGVTVYPIGGSITIEPGTRLGQIAFMQADAARMYAGGWNHAEGTHYATQQIH